MSKKPVRSTKPTPAIVRPALSPFDVEATPEAQKFLEGTISEIVTNFLAKGIRIVAVPIGQANAVKSAFEGAGPSAPEPNCGGLSTVLSSQPPQFKGRRWTVEIAKISGILAELHFHTDDDPRVTPPASAILPAVDALLDWSRTAEGAALGPDGTPLGDILGNLRVVRAMVDA